MSDSELEKCLEGALMSSMQPGVGESMHPDAKAIVCIAFKDSVWALKFQEAYVKVRLKISEEHE